MMCLASESPTSPSCMASGRRREQQVWQDEEEAVEVVLKRLTLAELIERQKRRFGVPIRTYAAQNSIELTVLN